MKKEIYQYYTEGKDEQKLLNTLKRDLKYIKSGKVEYLMLFRISLPLLELEPSDQIQL